jgi:hypothetical protein
VITDHRCAIVTLVRNGAPIFPLWLSYYRKHFAPQHIYVLDHDSTDGTTSGLDVNVIPVHNSKYLDMQWQNDLTHEWQAKLLKEYEYYIFVDADEILVADPAQYPGGLAEYLVRNTAPVVRCDGKSVVQNLSAETKEVDWGHPILEQRRWWFSAERDCKVVLSNCRLRFSWGCHWDTEAPPNQHVRIQRPVDPHLLLLHLHRVDIAHMIRRHAWMREQDFWVGGDARGVHHRWSDEEVVRDMMEHQAHLEPIPARFDGSIL